MVTRLPIPQCIIIDHNTREVMSSTLPRNPALVRWTAMEEDNNIKAVHIQAHVPTYISTHTHTHIHVNIFLKHQDTMNVVIVTLNLRDLESPWKWCL